LHRFNLRLSPAKAGQVVNIREIRGEEKRITDYTNLHGLDTE